PMVRLASFVIVLVIAFTASSVRAQDLAKAKSSASARDVDGFPLPIGAIARLGTLRWRTTEYVTSLAFSRDGKRLVSADRHSVRLWEVDSGKELGAAAEPFIERAVFNHDGSRLLLVAGQTLVLRNGHDAKAIGEYLFHGSATGVYPHPKKDTVAVI